VNITDLCDARWKKSTHSAANGCCIEVAGLRDRYVGVRDSKDVVGPVLTFTSAEWGAFLANVKDGGYEI